MGTIEENEKFNYVERLVQDTKTSFTLHQLLKKHTHTKNPAWTTQLFTTATIYWCHVVIQDKAKALGGFLFPGIQVNQT